MPKKRSKGVTILSIWLIFSGATGILGSTRAGYFAPPIIALNTAWLISAIICGIGLFLLKEWARKVTITLYAFSMVLGIFFLLRLGHIQWAQIIPDITQAQKTTIILTVSFIWLAWFLFIFFFLTRPQVKKQFKEVD